jgi:hypothetical protein
MSYECILIHINSHEFVLICINMGLSPTAPRGAPITNVVGKSHTDINDNSRGEILFFLHPQVLSVGNIIILKFSIGRCL